MPKILPPQSLHIGTIIVCSFVLGSLVHQAMWGAVALVGFMLLIAVVWLVQDLQLLHQQVEADDIRGAHLVRLLQRDQEHDHRRWVAGRTAGYQAVREIDDRGG